MVKKARGARAEPRWESRGVTPVGTTVSHWREDGFADSLSKQPRNHSGEIPEHLFANDISSSEMPTLAGVGLAFDCHATRVDRLMRSLLFDNSIEIALAPGLVRPEGSQCLVADANQYSSAKAGGRALMCAATGIPAMVVSTSSSESLMPLTSYMWPLVEIAFTP